MLANRAGVANASGFVAALLTAFECRSARMRSAQMARQRGLCAASRGRTARWVAAADIEGRSHPPPCVLGRAATTSSTFAGCGGRISTACGGAACLCR